MKRLAFVAILLIAAVVLYMPNAHADRQYTLCDASKSTLCAGLLALYEFNETASDTIRTSETGSARLVEIGTTETGVTSSGKLSYALNHTAAADDGLTISRATPLTGTLSMGFWIYVSTLPSGTGKKVPIIWMAPVQSSTESQIASGVYAGSSDTAPPMVYLYNSSGTTYVRYEVKQALSETTTYVQSTQSVAASTWYYVALGQYPTPTSTYPYQQTLWVNVSTTSMAARNTTTITYPDFGKVGHFMVAGQRTVSGDWEYGAFRLDQFGLWSRYLLDSELTTLIGSSGVGKAYPFY